MNLKEQIAANRKQIGELATSIGVYRMNPAVSEDVKAKEKELHDRLVHRLEEKEVEGQRLKIATMLEVLALYKGEKTPDQVNL